MHGGNAEVRLRDLNPNYVANTVTLSRTDPYSGFTTSQTVALPETVRVQSNQLPGQASQIVVGGDAAITLSGTLLNRGSDISVGGNLLVNAQSVDQGRSPALVNGATEATDPTDLGRFVAQVNTARGAGQSVFTGGYDPDTGQPVYTTTSAYTVNPVSSGGTTVTSGVAGNTRIGGSATLSVGNLTQDGQLIAAGNLTVNSSGAVTNNGTTAAGNDLSFTAASLSNNPGATLLAGRDLSLGTGASPIGALLNSAASIEAGRDLTINAGTLTNQSGATTTVKQDHLTVDRDATLNQYFAAVTRQFAANPTVRDKLLYPETGGATVENFGSGRIKIYGPGNVYIDSGLDYLQLSLFATTPGTPASISAGRNARINATGAITNSASVINAGANLTVSAGGLSNSAGLASYQLDAINCASAVVPCAYAGPDQTEGSRYTLTTQAAGALQAGGALSVAVAGAIVNTGNILGQAVSLSGSSLVNGITSVNVPALTSTQPAQVIPLVGPGLPGSYGGARAQANQTANTTIATTPVSGAASVGALSGSVRRAAVTAQAFNAVPVNTGNASVSDSRRSVAPSTHVVADASPPTQSSATTAAVALTQPTIAQGQFGFVAGTPAGQAAPIVAQGAGPGIRYLTSNPATGILAPLTADYLLSLLPAALHSGTSMPFYADPYVEQQLLRQAALAQTGSNYFLNGLAYDDQHQVSIDTQQRALLYAAAARFATDHNVKLGQALTQEQIGQLDAPMLWYVESQAPDPDCAGQTNCASLTALVPTVYLPKLYTDTTTSLAGGLIQGEDVSIAVTGSLTNTGYIAASQSLSITAQDFLNGKRNADAGRVVTQIDKGYVATTGTTVQPGGFVTAAKLSINASRIESISGEFRILSDTQAKSDQKSQDLLASLKQQLGASFTDTVAQDDFHQEVHVDAGMDLLQIVILVVAIVVSIYTAGAASGLIGEALGATAGSGGFFAAAGTASMVEAGTAVSIAGAGLGNVAVSAAIGSMASSAVTGVLTGNFSWENTLKAGLTGGLTAGLTNGLIGSLGQGAGFADKVVYGAKAAVVSAGVNSAVNGGSFKTAFVNSFVTNASASAANWIGDNAGLGQVLGDSGGAGHVAAHALLGCATAAAQSKDCASGAIGGAGLAYLTSFIDDPLQRAANGDPILDVNGNTARREWTDSEKALVVGSAALAGGVIAAAAGKDGLTAVETAQNEAQNNRLLHADEYKLLRDKARDIARQNLGSDASASDLKTAEIYWYDLLVSDALAATDAQSRDERIAYLRQIGASGQPAKTTTEGNFYAAGYLRDAQLAREAVSNLAGNPILGANGQSIIADGQALTTFQASPDQFRDHQLFSPTATVADRVRQFGDPLAAINANYGASQKANDSALSFITYHDQARLERFSMPNGQAAPNTIDLDIALGLWGPMSAAGQQLRSLVGEWSTARAGGEAAARGIDAARIVNNFYRDGGVLEQPYPRLLSEPISTSSDIIFKVNPNKTTTVLGSFGRDMENVIEQQLGYPKTIDFGARPGAFNCA